MKSKIIFILLFITSYCFGQSVPDTETFTLQDVVDAVSPSSNDLQQCFYDANTLYFDPAYNDVSYAPAGSLLRFRNYNVITTTMYMTNTNATIGSGDNFNFIFSYTTSGGYSGAISVPSLTIENDYFFTGALGTTHFIDGDYDVYLYFASGATSPYMQFRVRMIRVNSSGTTQDYSAWSSYQYASDTSVKHFTISNIYWLSGSTSDRMGLQIQWNNTNPSSTEVVSIDLGGGGNVSYIVIPGSYL